MTRILAIDPGSEQSAWLLWDKDSGSVVAFSLLSNEDLLESVRNGRSAADVVVIEQIESYGMAVGREVFATVHWSGRFTEAARPTPVVQLPRRAVKLAICGDSRAKDANIRQALLDRFGGKDTAVGTKRARGPLYGIKSDLWAALGVAVAWTEAAK